MATLILTLSVWLALLLPSLLYAADQKPPATTKPSSVQDLRYGVALYHYFQKDYYAALSELLVAEQRGGIQGHADTGQIMQGGLSLAMGMEKRAASIFSAVLDQPQSPEVRDAAWFYLAKLRYRRANWEGAAASLARVGSHLRFPMVEEYQALRANLAVRRGQLSEAEQALATASQLSPWLPYVYYNLGAAHVRQGNPAAGVSYFDTLAALPLVSEEHLALRDKALTAAGYSLMQQGDYPAAINRFTQVRLLSPLADQALLGYGWAASEMQNVAQALAPWQTLVQRSPANPSVQEALLAIPYAYEQAGANAEALAAFQAAEEGYQQQLAIIRGISEQLQPGKLLDVLRQDVDNPYFQRYFQRLAELLSRQSLQNQVSNLRGLLALHQRLQVWQDTLEIYQHLLEQREQRRDKRLEQIDGQRLPQQLTTLAMDYQKLSDELTRIVEQQDVMALADAATLRLWRRVENAADAVSLLKENGEETTSYQERLRRAKGVLLWRASQQFPDRLWRMRKALRQLQVDIADAGESRQRLDQIIVDAPDITPYRMRLAVLQQRLAEQLLAINEVLNQSEQQLLAVVRQQLQQQTARLQYYQGHARLAVARLYDNTHQGTQESPP